MKTPDDFQAQVAAHNITRWDTRPCSICGEWIGYIFHQGNPYFDAACECSFYHSEPQMRSWWDVADTYNIQINADVIARMDAFWHFDPQEAA